MTLTFHPAARDEFVAAAEYYEAAVSGLGGRFQVAVQRTTEIALAHPEAGSLRLGTRRLPVSGFPYDVVYRVRGASLEVLAVVHHHRRPGYWRERLLG